jgi:glycosyltransferase involved in cell wall biosynthesis
MGGDFGAQYLTKNAEKWFGGNPRDGIVLTLMDVWVLDPDQMSNMNMACWVPVDHEPTPPLVTEFFLRSGAIPIAMSRFGERMLGRLDPLYVPHAVDVDVYKPHDREAVRKATGISKDAFVVGMVAANKGRPSRKGFSQALQAFKQFADKHDDAYLYLHTTLNPDVAQGENLPALVDALGIPRDRVAFADQYSMLFDPLPADAMAGVYSMMDVLLNPSTGEGFGIPVLEASACGVPSIVTDFSAMSEVCGSGWGVAYDRFWTGQNSWQATPRVPDILDALEQCYSRSEIECRKGAVVARKHAMEYALPKVMKQHFLPALRIVEQRFRDREPVKVPPRKLKAAA